MIKIKLHKNEAIKIISALNLTTKFNSAEAELAHRIIKKVDKALNIPIVGQSFYCLSEQVQGENKKCTNQCKYCKPFM